MTKVLAVLSLLSVGVGLSACSSFNEVQIELSQMASTYETQVGPCVALAGGGSLRENTRAYTLLVIRVELVEQSIEDSAFVYSVSGSTEVRREGDDELYLWECESRVSRAESSLEARITEFQRSE